MPNASNTIFARQLTWYIDPVSGNDENDGKTSGTALATDEARQRRMGSDPLWDGGEYHIYVLTDLPATDRLGLFGRRTRNTQIFVHGSATAGAGATTLFSGTIDSLVALNRTSSPQRSWEITSSAISVSWTASSLIGQRIRLTSGTNNGAMSWSMKDLGSKATKCSAFIQKDTFTLPWSWNAFTKSPASTNTFVVERLTKIPNFVCSLRATDDLSSGTFGVGVVFDSLDVGNGSFGPSPFHTNDTVAFDGCIVRFLSGNEGTGVCVLNACRVTGVGVPSQGMSYEIYGGYCDVTFGSSHLAVSNMTIDSDFMVEGRQAILSGDTFVFRMAVFHAPASIGAIRVTAASRVSFHQTGWNSSADGIDYPLVWGDSEGDGASASYGVQVDGGNLLNYNGALTGITIKGATGDFVVANQATCRAYDNAIGQFTDPRTCSWANLAASVASGGFGGRLVDPIGNVAISADLGAESSVSQTQGNALQIGAAGARTFAPINLAGGAGYITGALPLANGGTGQTSFAAGILHSSGTALSSSAVVNGDIANATITTAKWDPTGLSSGQTWSWNGSSFVATSIGAGTITQVVAGNGLTGGGSSGSVTLDVAAADATITVTANAIAVGQIANANVAAGAAISYSKLNLTGSVVNADIVSLAWSKITGHPTDLGGYGITDAAASSINLIAGAGMTGGGTLTSNRTFNVIANVDGSIVVNADDIQVGIVTDAQHGSRAGGSLHPGATTSVAGFITMTHDLAGTGGSPNVVAISGAGGTAAVRCANLLFEAAVTSASIGQTISSATTSPLTIFAQHTTSGTGAALNLSSGFGGSPGNNVGAINLQLGTVTKLSLLATPELQWDQAVNEPLYTQAAAASGNNGVTTTHRAQDGVGTNKSGGKWRAFGGAKTGTGLAGGAQIGLGGSIVMVEAVEVASGKYVSSLNHLTSVSTSATGSDPGSLVTYVGDCSSAPATASIPASGALLFSQSGAGTWKGSNNCTTVWADAGGPSKDDTYNIKFHGDLNTIGVASGTVLSINFRDYGASAGTWDYTIRVIIKAHNTTDGVTVSAWARIYAGQIVGDSPTSYGSSSMVQNSSGEITGPTANVSINGNLGPGGTNRFDMVVGSTGANNYRWFAVVEMDLVRVS